MACSHPDWKCVLSAVAVAFVLSGCLHPHSGPTTGLSMRNRKTKLTNLACG
jgi:hypothetical protein